MTNTKTFRSSFDLKSADEDIRLRIKDLRLTRGVTQAEIADQLGIVHQQYHKYEAGILRFSASMLIAIAEFLDCPISDLVPQQMQTGSPLGQAERMDLLKMRLQTQIQNCNSEQLLLAFSTLIGEEQMLKLVVNN